MYVYVSNKNNYVKTSIVENFKDIAVKIPNE